jgi:NADH dehydrogenase
MTTQVVVLGAGYAGTGAVKRLERELDGAAELTWISEHDYHLVLHEVHRCIRDPEVESKVAIPITEVKSPSTAFVRDRVVDVDVDDRTVHTESGEAIDYDYLLVCVGTRTAFYGIDGLQEHSYTLKGLDDAREIHDAVEAASRSATRTDPARIVVGGAGLSGIQAAGEIAEYRDEHRAPIEIQLVEGLDEVFPGNDPEVQGAIRKRLQDRDVEILTGDFISKVDDRAIYLAGAEETVYGDLGETAADGGEADAETAGDVGGSDADEEASTPAVEAEAEADGGEVEAEPGDAGASGSDAEPEPEPEIDFSNEHILPYDVLVWTGGITGQEVASSVEVEQDERSHRLNAGADFTTSDDRVFALGDSALVEQHGEQVAPPTAQAAWQAADVAGENVARAIRGQPLRSWSYDDKGTLVSVGETAIAHDVTLPGGIEVPMNTFGGPAAVALKKGVACRWIRDVSSIRRAVDAWSDM